MKDYRPGMSARLCAFVLALLGLLTGRSWAANQPECIKDSNEKSGVIIQSAPCGIYGEVIPRESNGEDVLVRYMVHTPDGLSKALVVLFAGGNGNAGIVGNPITGEVSEAGNNFLVRSAQLFATDKYLAVTINRPLVGPGLDPEFLTNPEFDQYRASADHGADIAAVIAAVNTDNLAIFFAGTSRGTLSAVAQHQLNAGIVGILLSSPVTSGGGPSLFVGHPDYPNLQPEFVTVPVHVLAHELDGCPVSTPENSEALHDEFVSLEIDSEFDELSGGFDLTGTGGITECDAKTHHGFLGIENRAVKKITKRMDGILKALKKD